MNITTIGKSNDKGPGRIGCKKILFSCDTERLISRTGWCFYSKRSWACCCNLDLYCSEINNVISIQRVKVGATGPDRGENELIAG